jgi:hypothetical protein
VSVSRDSSDFRPIRSLAIRVFRFSERSQKATGRGVCPSVALQLLAGRKELSDRERAFFSPLFPPCVLFEEGEKFPLYLGSINIPRDFRRGITAGTHASTEGRQHHERTLPPLFLRRKPFSSFSLSPHRKERREITSCYSAGCFQAPGKNRRHAVSSAAGAFSVVCRHACLR